MDDTRIQTRGHLVKAAAPVCFVDAPDPKMEGLPIAGCLYLPPDGDAVAALRLFSGTVTGAGLFYSPQRYADFLAEHGIDAYEPARAAVLAYDRSADEPVLFATARSKMRMLAALMEYLHLEQIRRYPYPTLRVVRDPAKIDLAGYGALHAYDPNDYGKWTRAAYLQRDISGKTRIGALLCDPACPPEAPVHFARTVGALSARDPHRRDLVGVTGLLVLHAQRESYDILLGNNPWLATSPGAHHMQLIHYAAMAEDPYYTEDLIARGAPVNADYGIGLPLTMAVEKGRHRNAELLLAAGSHLDDPSIMEPTLLQYAANVSDREMYRIILPYWTRAGREPVPYERHSLRESLDGTFDSEDW